MDAIVSTLEEVSVEFAGRDVTHAPLVRIERNRDELLILVVSTVGVVG